MSGIVRGVKNLLRGGSSSKPAAKATTTATKTATAGAEGGAEKPRVAMQEEIENKLRRRRGSRTLLSQERIDAETGLTSLAGEQTTLGGM